MTLASLSTVVVKLVHSPFGLQHTRAIFGRQYFGVVAGHKVQFPDFEDYASMTFVGDYIADSSSHMATPRRDIALVLLQI